MVVPATFSPPLAIQQSIWDSITNGNFIDAKIFAFSRRSCEAGRVDTPKALFVNTHVLATACSYFRSTFDLSDGIETSLTEELPPGVDTAFSTEEDDQDEDYDPIEGSPTDTQLPRKAPALILSERTIKAYVVKYTAYRTLRAVIWYIYSGEIFFSPNSSPESPSASAKSLYRFADEHEMDDLKQLAFREISTSVNRLGLAKLAEDAFSVFASRHPELHGLYIQRLRPLLSGSVGDIFYFQQQLTRYFSGGLPHSKDFLASLLQALMDGPAASSPRGDDSRTTISRVSRPWPSRTKKALRISLDNGTFEDTRIVVSSGQESTRHSIHFAGAVNEEFGSSISRLCQSEATFQHDIRTSLSTWRAIAYYMYAGCINFKPLGSQSTESAPAHNPSDTQFRGCLCSLREVLSLALKLATCDALVDLAADGIVSGMTLDNVVEEMFCDPSQPKKIIDRGVQIIQGNYRSAHIRSQLQKILEEASSGGGSANAVAFSACFVGLFRLPYYYD